MTAQPFTRQQYEETVAFIRQRSQQRPRVGLILGSGLGLLADEIEEADVIKYEEIPHWPVSTVAGHAGRLVLGRLEGQTVIVQQGRSHFYEGYSTAQITYPVRVMRMLGAQELIVTNAAGGINADFEAGDLMLITDHLNFPSMVGFSPLRGPNDEFFGPRFPNMALAYHPSLRAMARQTAQELGISLRAGVYACLSGPNFETPAELRLLATIGADAVGMSTAHETIVANHCGMRVLGFSGITNKVILDPEEAAAEAEEETLHDAVLEMGKVIVPKLASLLKGVLRQLG